MDELEQIDTPYGRFLSFPNDLITGHLRQYGAHQRNELAMLLAFTRPGDTIIDVGANIGTYAIPLAARATGNGHVYAFEADEDIFRVLQKNIALNECENATAVSGLVGRTSGAYRKSRPEGNWGGTSFELDEPGADSGTPIILIDDWCRSNIEPGEAVDIIKIDVEGMDFDALLSCEDTIRTYKPVVYIEIARNQLAKHGHSPADVGTLLAGMGYHFFRNIGERNSANDVFVVARFPRVLVSGVGEGDLLAVHAASSRYPADAKSRLYMIGWYMLRGMHSLLRRISALGSGTSFRARS